MLYSAHAATKNMPEDPVKAEAVQRWREKLMYFAPLMILLGLVLLSGIL